MSADEHRAFRHKVTVQAIHDLAVARLGDPRVQDGNVRHDLTQIAELSKQLLEEMREAV